MSAKKFIQTVKSPGQRLLALILGNRGGGVFAKLKPKPPALDTTAFCDDDFKGTVPGEKEISGTVTGKLKRL